MPQPKRKWSSRQNNTRSKTQYYKPWPPLFTLGLFSPIIPLFAILTIWLRYQRITPLIIYSACSMLSFAFYGYDKYRATNAGWRVRENLLHILDAMGGWPGGFVAQYAFNHKIRKASFQLIFWATVLAHQGAWLWWLLGKPFL
jgi:uncharacterized membrane protein YsdA (DUF1294 family)